MLFNGTQGKKERMTHLLRPFADDLRPVEEAAEGTTVVAVGLKNTRTGDTLVLRWAVAGGWWLVAGGWWLVAGGWWRVAGGWRLVAGGWLADAAK